MTTTSRVPSNLPKLDLVQSAAAASWIVFLMVPSALRAQDTAAWISAATSSNSMEFIDAKSLTWRGTTLTGWQISCYQRGLPNIPNVGWSIARVNWTCGQSSATMALERVLYARSRAVLDRFPAETNWSENIPGTIGEGVAKLACSFAPRDMNSRKQVNRSTSEELRRQIPENQLFDYRAVQMNCQEGGADAIYYDTGAFYYAEAFDCGKKPDGSGQQAVRKYPAGSSTSITWQDFDYARCNLLKEGMIRQRVALSELYLEERQPVASIEEVLAKAKREMPWPTVARPKRPTAQAPTKARKKR
jgi:hypothetical protein